ncbi:MAG: dihydropteroate synthase [Bacillota bacterium]|jgi:5-methyltetrahydrofolate--homocysteine methyltransferase
METIVKSKTKTVVIGPEHPFTIIGERINPTGRKAFAAELKEGNLERVAYDAKKQVEAGAHILDVNVGAAGVDEKKLMKEACQLLDEITDVPLCFDSSKSDVLETALKFYEGKALVNSVTGEEERMNAVLPLVKEYGAAVIVLPFGEGGIPDSADERFRIAADIVERGEKLGIPREDMVIDCLTMTLSSNAAAGKITLDTMKRIRDELGCNMSLGVSNISFGLPDRETINSVFMVAAIENGLTAAIIDPTKPEMKKAVLIQDMLAGKDKHCMTYIRESRKNLS